LSGPSFGVPTSTTQMRHAPSGGQLRVRAEDRHVDLGDAAASVISVPAGTSTVRR
jgi:hypothetical protein